MSIAKKLGGVVLTAAVLTGAVAGVAVAAPTKSAHSVLPCPATFAERPHTTRAIRSATALTVCGAFVV